VNVSLDRENPPPPYSNLNFGNKTDSENAISEKFNNDKLLPNYSKDSELALQSKIKELSKISGAPESIVSPVAPGAGEGGAGTSMGAPIVGGTAPVVGIPAPASIISSSMKCKFLNSAQCHPDYPNFSGASIQFPEGSTNMKCDNVGEVADSKAVCTISNGKINGVYIINPGAGYKVVPKVEAIGGGGEGAILNAVLVNGKIKEVKVINGGSGFHETPVLKIENPNSSNGCFLCCK
jgi:hypothetical protein